MILSVEQVGYFISFEIYISILVVVFPCGNDKARYSIAGVLKGLLSILQAYNPNRNNSEDVVVLTYSASVTAERDLIRMKS